MPACAEHVLLHMLCCLERSAGWGGGELGSCLQLHMDAGHLLTHIGPITRRIIAAATVPGALQLLRFGTTQAARPASGVWRIQDCMMLALSQLWLLESQPGMLTQVLPVTFHVAIFTAVRTYLCSLHAWADTCADCVPSERTRATGWKHGLRDCSGIWRG